MAQLKAMSLTRVTKAGFNKQQWKSQLGPLLRLWEQLMAQVCGGWGRSTGVSWGCCCGYGSSSWHRLWWGGQEYGCELGPLLRLLEQLMAQACVW